MQAIGIVLLLAGIALVAIAIIRGRETGTTVTEGPPPPRPTRNYMASGLLCVLAGLALTIMASV